MVREVVECRYTLAIAVGVRRAEVGGNEAKGLGKDFLVLQNLLNLLVLGDCVEVLVTPGVTSELVACAQHPL